MIGRTGFAGIVHIICKGLLSAVLLPAVLPPAGLPPAGLLSAGLLFAGLLAGPAQALQVLEGADNAELEAEISAVAVNRIALEHDRVIRVVQAPGGLAVEHDPVRGDVYLYPDSRVGGAEPMVLYLGTERGLTYRLSLRVAERDSAQILIRNSGIGATLGAVPRATEPYTDELVQLIRAVASREPLPGYSIALAGGSPAGGSPAGGTPAGGSPGGDKRTQQFRELETWRGPHWTARVVTAPGDGSADAAAVAAHFGGHALAAWVSDSPRADGARMAVIVEANGPLGADR